VSAVVSAVGWVASWAVALVVLLVAVMAAQKAVRSAYPLERLKEAKRVAPWVGQLKSLTANPWQEQLQSPHRA